MEVCKQTFPDKILYHASVAPAAFIILLLTLSRYYRTKKFSLVLPFKFLADGNNDRLRYVLAFGSFASVVLKQVLVKSVIAADVSISWIFRPFFTMILAIELGFIYYPVFACINSKSLLLGRGVGCCYVLFQIIQTIGTVSMWTCAPNISQFSDIILPAVPDLICSFALLMLLIKDVITSIYYEELEDTRHKGCVLSKNNAIYVRKIFEKKQAAVTTFFERIQWRSNPSFKYSTLLLSMMLILVIFFFQLTYTLTSVFIVKLQAFPPELLPLVTLVYGSLVIYIGQVLRFMVCHRENMLKMYKGESKCNNTSKISHHYTVIHYLSFIGYLIGFTIIGAALYALILTLVGAALVALIRNKLFTTAVINQLLKSLYSVAVIPLVCLVLQHLTAYFVFTEARGNHMSSTWIDNLGVYHIFLYFFFFGNLLVGVFTCLFSTLFGILISLSSLGRIDIAVMNPDHYLIFDRGHKAYLSYLKVESTFRNPTMRCFCQILLEQRDEKFVHTNETKFARCSTRALNRWHLAVLLIRNPSLVKYRKQEKYFMKTTPNYNDEMKAMA